MIRNLLKLTGQLIGVGLLLGTTQAIADPHIDLVPTKINYRVAIDDDISMHRSQHVYIYLYNQGNVSYNNTKPMLIKIGNRYVNGYVYGPDDEGGSRGGPIRPHKTGKVSFNLPLGTLRHCQKLDVHIDVAKRHQVNDYHGDVFRNDKKNLQVIDMKSRLLCARIIPRPIIPRPIIPRPGVGN